MKEKVLIVDDERNISELARRILTGEGYPVSVAQGGEDALAMITGQPFDILLTDIRMPGMSGLELIKLVKARQPAIIVVVITGHGTVSTAVESLKLGASGFVLKPFTPDELHATVLHATKKHRLLTENARLHSLVPLFEVTRALVGEQRQLDLLLNKVVEVVTKEIAADRVSLMLYDERRDALALRAGAADHRPESSGDSVVSSLSVPLISHKRLVGVLNLAKLSGRPFNEGDVELVSILCGQAAVMIDNARLYRAIQNSHYRTLAALVAAIEVKDVASRGHSRDVARYSGLIGRRLGLPPMRMNNLFLASILHDVGKLGCSDIILSKEGKLNAQEYRQVKEHPEAGVRIVLPIGLAPEVLDAIQQHHERWDGSGYPQGLRKEAISLTARILAVADAAESMLSSHPFRQVLPLKIVRQELRQETGRQFDPQIANVFLSFTEEDLANAPEADLGA